MAVGLTVTMGLMRFTNLAHTSLCMLGGYLMVQTIETFELSFALALVGAFLGAVCVSYIVERVLLRHFYGADQLSQALLTIGLLYVSVAAAAWLWGPSYRPVNLPGWVTGNFDVVGIGIERYRLLLLGLGGLLTLITFYGLERTEFGAKVRACVDNPRVAQAHGLNTSRIFSITFAIGGGLAGLGGALSANMIGLDPNFPFRVLIIVLVVVSVGGLGSVPGALVAALLFGLIDVLSKYYLSDLGSIPVYILAICTLLWRPHGLLKRG